MHGKGKFTQPNGDIYDGEWVENNRNGHGVKTDKGQAAKLGFWHEGELIKWL